MIEGSWEGDIERVMKIRGSRKKCMRSTEEERIFEKRKETRVI